MTTAPTTPSTPSPDPGEGDSPPPPRVPNDVDLATMVHDAIRNITGQDIEEVSIDDLIVSTAFVTVGAIVMRCADRTGHTVSLGAERADGFGYRVVAYPVRRDLSRGPRYEVGFVCHESNWAQIIDNQLCCCVAHIIHHADPNPMVTWQIPMPIADQREALDAYQDWRHCHGLGSV